jgi:elongation factor Tu
VFSIEGRGTVGTGRIDRGIVQVGDKVDIVGLREDIQKSSITGVEMFQKTLESGQAGDNVGVLLRGIEKKGPRARHGRRGSGLDHPAHQVRVRGVRALEGGRRTPHAVLQRLPAAVLLPHDGRDRSLQAPGGAEMCMPGDNVKLEVELMIPVAMDEQLRFAIREGGRTVGAGVVTKILK